MTSYVEQSTLKLVDRTTKPARRINRELLKVLKTGEKLGKLKINIAGLDSSIRGVERLDRTLKKLPRARNVRVGATINVAGLTKLENRLDKLRKTPKTSLEFQTKGAVQAIAQMERMQKLLVDIRKGANAKLSTTGKAPATGAASPGSAVPSIAAATALAAPRTSGAFGSSMHALATPFPGNIPMAFNISSAYMTVRGLELASRTAVTATLDAQTVDTSNRLLFSNPVIRAELERVGRDVAASTTNTTISRGIQIATDMYKTGFRGPVLEQLAPFVGRMEAASMAFAPDKAQSITTLANKLGNLAAVTEDPERAKMVIKAAFQAAALQGETFNASTFLSALRISGKAQTLNEEGFLRFALATDELGRILGSGVQRMSKILTIRQADAGAGGGVAKGTVDRLIKMGMRGKDGLSDEQRQRFDQDPLGYIAGVVNKLAAEKGLDPTKVEDRPQVAQLLTELGFVGREARAILNEIAANAEREKAIPLGLSIDPTRLDEAAADDLGFQLRNLAEQFKSFSAETLKPLFEILAPGVRVVADFLQSLANAEGTAAQLKRLGVVAGIAAGALALFKVTAAAASRSSMATLARQAAKGVTPAQAVANASTKGLPGISGMQKMFLSVNTVSLAAQIVNMDMSGEAIARRNEKFRAGVDNFYDMLGLGGFKDWMDQREARLIEAARADEVGFLRRAVRSMSGNPLPLPDQATIAASKAAVVDKATGEKIDRLIAVQERNWIRIGEEGRSEASVNDLLRQNQELSQQVIDLGGQASLLPGDNLLPSDLSALVDTPASLKSAAEESAVTLGGAGTEMANQFKTTIPGAGTAMAREFLNGIAGASVGVGGAPALPAPTLDTGVALPR